MKSDEFSLFSSSSLLIGQEQQSRKSNMSPTIEYIIVHPHDMVTKHFKNGMLANNNREREREGNYFQP